MQETLVTQGNPVLALSMEVDMASADEVSSLLAPLIEAGGPIVIDLSGVHFMDSTGLNVLIHAATSIGERGCIILHGANHQVSRLFEMTQLCLQPNIHIVDCAQMDRTGGLHDLPGTPSEDRHMCVSPSGL